MKGYYYIGEEVKQDEKEVQKTEQKEVKQDEKEKEVDTKRNRKSG